jgi:hypothetical protein
MLKAINKLGSFRPIYCNWGMPGIFSRIGFVLAIVEFCCRRLGIPLELGSYENAGATLWNQLLTNGEITAKMGEGSSILRVFSSAWVSGPPLIDVSFRQISCRLTVRREMGNSVGGLWRQWRGRYILECRKDSGGNYAALTVRHYSRISRSGGIHSLGAGDAVR